MYVASDKEEGLYNLYFHNCPASEDDAPNMNMMVRFFGIFLFRKT